MRGGRGVAATGVACAATAACVALAVHAAADEPRVALAWSAPTACPDEAQVRASVAQLLAGSSATVVDGRAEVRRSGERWQVVLTMNGGERRLEADSCRALADATALIVAMAVDPARVAANRSALDAGVASANLPNGLASVLDASADAAPANAPDAAPPPAAPRPPPPAPPPPLAPQPPPASPSSSPSPSPSTRVALSAAATVDVGTLPTTAFGPSFGLAWTPWPLRLELALAYFPASSVPVPEGFTGSSVQFSLLAAALRGCYQARLSSFELGPCVGVEGGRLQGNPQGFSGTEAAPTSGSAPLFAVDAGLLAAWRFFPSLALVARGDALLQTTRPTFVANAASLQPPGLYQPGLVTGRGSLGVELRF